MPKPRLPKGTPLGDASRKYDSNGRRDQFLVQGGMANRGPRSLGKPGGTGTCSVCGAEGMVVEDADLTGSATSVVAFGHSTGCTSTRAQTLSALRADGAQTNG